jgi:hypothetical protein
MKNRVYNALCHRINSEHHLFQKSIRSFQSLSSRMYPVSSGLIHFLRWELRREDHHWIGLSFGVFTIFNSELLTYVAGGQDIPTFRSLQSRSACISRVAIFDDIYWNKCGPHREIPSQSSPGVCFHPAADLSDK